MPRPDHELIYACTIPDVVLKPGQRMAVIALVEVRSDKASLDADDHERHTYGGAVRYVAHVGADDDVFDHLVRLAHRLGDGIETLSLFDGLSIDDPQTPVETVDDDVDWERPVTMADIQVDERPGQAVKLEHLAAVDLSPAAFYSAGRMLKLGRTLADVTEGWTDDQRAYLASFLAGPTAPKRTTRKRTPRTTPQEA